MNLGLIFRKVAEGCKTVAGNGLLFAKAHVPEMLVGGGIVGYGVTVYSACRATCKAKDILDARDEANESILDSGINGGGEEAIAMNNRNAKRRIVRAYIPAVTMGLCSTAMVLGGYRMINGRLVATAAAYKALETGFDRYRGNVISEFGSDVDWRMLNGISEGDLMKAEEERETNRAIDADNKRRRLKHKKKHTARQEYYSRIFDQYSDRWQRKWTPDQVLQYLRRKQREANDILKIRKHIFVNEVYDLLGMERSAEGQVVGWIITKNNPDSFVDFGLDDIPEEKLREILGAERNEDISIRLHFNPDGLIYNLIDAGKEPRYEAV